MLHPTPHKMPSNFTHSKTLSSVSDKSDSDVSIFFCNYHNTFKKLKLRPQQIFILTSVMSLHQSRMGELSIIILILRSRRQWSILYHQRRCCINHQIGSCRILHIRRRHLLFQTYQIQMWVFFFVINKTPFQIKITIITNFIFNQFDESSSKPDERTIDYHINKPSKAEMKSTSSSKKMSPHRRPSNSSHSKTPSFVFDRSESDVSTFL